MIQIANNLQLPIDFVTERIAFLARTGAGKSGGMRVLFEQFIDAGQFCIFVDPKGDAYGIRADGKKPGKPVLVIGGDHGDLPLEATAGKVIAEFLVKERVSTVVDISDLSSPKMWRFMADFTATLYKLNREVLHMFIDEVDMIAGQTYFDPDCLHGIQLIQNKGRARGFGLTIATQRPQIVNKTILNASGTLIAMQTLGDDALKVVKSWLSQSGTKEAAQSILSQLPTLKTREAFIYSPQLLGIEPKQITFAEFQTFDSMRTPKPGEARQAPKKLAEIDLEAIKRDMSSTIEHAKSNDPAVLKKQIADLNNQLKEARQALTAQQVLEPSATTIEIPVLDQEALARFEDAFNAFLNDWLDMLERFMNAINPFTDRSQIPATGKLYNVLAELQRSVPSLPERLATVSPLPEKPKTASSSIPKSIPAMRNELLSTPQQKILDALAFAEALGTPQPERITVAFFAGYTVNGHFNNTVGKLNASGLISYPVGGHLALTDEGRALADISSIEIATLEDLHEIWRSKLSEPQRRILNVLLNYRGRPVSREELAQQAGYTVNGHFNNTVGKLNSLGAACYPQKGYVAAAPVMFPEGLN